MLIPSQVDLPYSHMVNYCKILDLVAIPGVVQHCWGILNDAYVRPRLMDHANSHSAPDSLQTPVYTHHPPPTLACFSIHLAARLRGIPLPDQWWVLFDAELDDMVACCGWVMGLWKRWGDGAGGEGEGNARERWAVTVKMASSRHYVRSYIQDGSLRGEYGWIDV